MLNTSKTEFQKHLKALQWPVFAVLLAWIVWLVADKNAATWGLYPKTTQGLAGILTMPFLHDFSDPAHIINNSIAFLFMGWMLFYFYKPVAWKIWLIVWLAGGFWTWIIGRPSFHIGMSGWVYGLGFYLVTAAFLRKNKQLIAGALILILEYGSMVWGIFPVKHMQLSWEGHLAGAIAGVLAAVYYRKIFPSEVEPQRQWPPEDDNEEDKWWEEPNLNKNDEQVKISYTFKPKDGDNQ